MEFAADEIEIGGYLLLSWVLLVTGTEVLIRSNQRLVASTIFTSSATYMYPHPIFGSSHDVLIDSLKFAQNDLTKPSRSPQHPNPPKFLTSSIPLRQTKSNRIPSARAIGCQGIVHLIEVSRIGTSNTLSTRLKPIPSVTASTCIEAFEIAI